MVQHTEFQLSHLTPQSKTSIKPRRSRSSTSWIKSKEHECICEANECNRNNGIEKQRSILRNSSYNSQNSRVSNSINSTPSKTKSISPVEPCSVDCVRRRKQEECQIYDHLCPDINSQRDGFPTSLKRSSTIHRKNGATAASSSLGSHKSLIPRASEVTETTLTTESSPLEVIDSLSDSNENSSSDHQIPNHNILLPSKESVDSQTLSEEKDIGHSGNLGSNQTLVDQNVERPPSIITVRASELKDHHRSPFHAKRVISKSPGGKRFSMLPTMTVTKIRTNMASRDNSLESIPLSPSLTQEANNNEHRFRKMVLPSPAEHKANIQRLDSLTSLNSRRDTKNLTVHFSEPSENDKNLHVEYAPPPHESLTEEERFLSFYSKDDLANFERDSQLTLLHFRTLREKGIAWEETNHSLRGLEEYVFTSKIKSRRQVRKEHIESVLHEQERLRSAGLPIENSDCIRDVSIAISKHDSSRAIALAAKDAKEAGHHVSGRHSLMKTFKKLSKRSLWRASVVNADSSESGGSSRRLIFGNNDSRRSVVSEDSSKKDDDEHSYSAIASPVVNWASVAGRTISEGAKNLFLTPVLDDKH